MDKNQVFELEAENMKKRLEFTTFSIINHLYNCKCETIESL